MHTSLSDLNSYLSSFLETTPLRITNHDLLLSEGIDTLVYDSQFASEEIQTEAQRIIFELASLSSPPASLRKLYEARRDGKTPVFTVPAINMRALTYDVSRLIFRLMKNKEIGTVVFEISRSESGYTDQSYAQFSAAVLAGAIKEAYQGPVFLQADHLQVGKEDFLRDSVGELNRMKDLIKQAISAKLFNIDIDASTLVEYSRDTIEEQQRDNIIITSELTNSVRMHEPADLPLTVGGEVGHIGDTNTTEEEVEVFLAGLEKNLAKDGIQKLSIQTGTTHGGNINETGQTLPMPVDFALIATLDTVAKEAGVCGVVQHGASTLPLEQFPSFPASHALEIHLATQIQNILFDHLPSSLRQEMETWVNALARDDNQTPEQHFYRMRKKSLGEFKQKLWDLSPEEKETIMMALSAYLDALFTSLQIPSTANLTHSLYA